jgi:hypothetical protein
MFDKIDLGGAITDTIRTVALFVPKVLAFAVILVVGWVVARMLQRACATMLQRAGFNRIAERAGIGRLLAGSRYDACLLVGKLVNYAAMLLTLQLAFAVWGPNPVSDLLKSVVAWLPQAAIAIAIVVVAGSIARAVRDIVGTALGGLSYGRLLARGCATVIACLGVIAALNQIGVALTVTLPVLITVLATVGGILVVGAGGGLVRPMQARWERWLNRAEAESSQLTRHAQAYAAGRADTATQYVTAPAATGWPTLNPANAGPSYGKPTGWEHNTGREHSAGYEHGAGYEHAGRESAEGHPLTGAMPVNRPAPPPMS